MSTTKEFPSRFSKVARSVKLKMGANFKALKGTQAYIARSGGNQGYVVEGSSATDLLSIGRFAETVDNTGGAAGALEVEVLFHREFELVHMLNDSGSPLDQTDVGGPCYGKDNNTVTADATGRSIAGIVWGFDEHGLVKYEPTSRFIPGAAEAASVSIADAASLFASTETEGALTELAHSMGQVNVPLTSFVVASTGAPLGAFNDGVADGFDYAEGVAIRFNVASTAKVAATIPLPQDFDGGDITVHMLASRVGALDVTAAIDVEAFFQTVGAAYDADDDAGDTTGAIAGATKVVSELSVTIAAANTPVAPAALSITLVPTAALDADDMRVHAVWIEYGRKNIAA